RGLVESISRPRLGLSVRIRKLTAAEPVRSRAGSSKILGSITPKYNMQEPASVIFCRIQVASCVEYAHGPDKRLDRRGTSQIQVDVAGQHSRVCLCGPACGGSFLNAGEPARARVRIALPANSGPIAAFPAIPGTAGSRARLGSRARTLRNVSRPLRPGRL